jgi:hypothetical protein
MLVNFLSSSQNYYLRQIVFYSLCVFLFQSCGNPNLKNVVDNAEPKPHNYTEVGVLMDSVKTPYVIDVKSGDKRLVFIGCVHQQDSTHPQFKLIETYYKEFAPQLAFNEGGQIAKDKTYSNLNEAIRNDGETGVNKYCADKLGVELLNGDTKDSLEFAINVKRNDVKKLFVYYIIERLAVPYKYGAYENSPFIEVYNKRIDRWFKHYPLTKNEKSFENFKSYYKAYTGTNFLLTHKNSSYEEDSLNVEAFDYVNADCEFCEIGRSSKTLRDSVLMSKIKLAFKTKNRILVTFGHGHALALEPVLKGIFQN